VIVLAGWMNQRQQNLIEYLREEAGVLREQLGDRCLWFTDGQRRRLAVRARIGAQIEFGRMCPSIGQTSS